MGSGHPLPPPKMGQKWVKKQRKLIKINDKKWSKTVFLNGKIEFFTKIHQIRQKMTKNDQKLTSKCSVKIGHNLTTKTGDSGSAGLLEEKCVIIEALNLDTKIIKN